MLAHLIVQVLVLKHIVDNCQIYFECSENKNKRSVNY